MLDLRESTTYQEILAEGREEGRKAMETLVLQSLEHRFGSLPEHAKARIRTFATGQLGELGSSIFDLATLDDLERWLAER